MKVYDCGYFISNEVILNSQVYQYELINCIHQRIHTSVTITIVQ